MRAAYFDSDGVCIVATTYPLAEHDYPYVAGIPDEGKPSDYWFNAASSTVEETLKVDSLADELGLLETYEVGSPVSLTVPDNCVVEIHGIRYSGNVTVTFDEPIKTFVRLLGQKHGEALVSVNSYVENRQAIYPTAEEQLDMIYNLGLDGWKRAIAHIKNQYPKPD
jgi:hypothetical protein